MPPRIYSREEELLLRNDFDVLLFLGWSWLEIANHLHVTERTLFRIRTRIEYVPVLSHICDTDLDEMVRRFTINHPETGNIKVYFYFVLF